MGPGLPEAEPPRLERLMVTGPDGHFGPERVSEIISETLGLSIPTLRAEDLGLALPSQEISFNTIAAPAGLATLAWG
jgi:hypothetical protein